MIGDDGAGNQVGMAPGAQWIGCRNMDQGNGTPARYIECMEFLRLTRFTARRTKATRLKRLILRITPGVAQLRKGALPAASCRPLLKLKKLRVSKWS